MTDQHKDKPVQQDTGKSAPQRNEGEGNRTAARQYNQAQERFARSGQVEEKAREAERARNNKSERRDMDQAELIGKRHAAAEDPAVKRR